MSDNSSSGFFLDSNIWLYAFIQSQDARKHEIANQISRTHALITSTQVINEVCVNLIRKAALNEKRIHELITAFYQNHTVIELGIEILLKASQLRNRYFFSFWDGLIVATALLANARTLISEDMQDGLIVDKTLEIKNSFSTRP